MGAILLGSLVARLVLVSFGGPGYWPDEERYERSRRIVASLWSGELPQVSHAEHFGFQILGTVPAAIELAIGEDPRIPAIFFGLFSVVNLWLVGRIAVRAGASEVESLLAVLTLAVTNCWFYYSRHILPYDVSLTLALAGLWWALDNTASARVAGVSGLWASRVS